MSNACKTCGTVKFGVFTDLHIDIMHDSLPRLRAFLAAAAKHDADFIVSLGDMTYPDNIFMAEETGESFENRNQKAFKCGRDEEKREVLRLLGSCGRPVHHVLGNHETDICTRAQVLKYLGAGKPFYSFDAGGHHFIVLDCNYILKDGEYVSYEYGNYHESPADARPYLPPEQLAWLEEDILSSPLPSVIFSHPSLTDEIWGVRNRAEVWTLFRRANAERKRVILCMNGHSHVDGMTTREGVYYVDVNSISNMWLGHPYACIRYSEEIDRDYPYIKYTAPYRDPLYALVTITEGRMIIEGTKSEFVGPSPYALGFPESNTDFVSTAAISDRILPI